MQTFRIQAHVCPECGYKMDSASAVSRKDNEQRPPKDGDVSVCLNCGALNLFDGGGLRRPTMVEEFRIHTSPVGRTVEKAQRLIKLLRKTKE